jgi:hypothetical protein
MVKEQSIGISSGIKVCLKKKEFQVLMLNELRNQEDKIRERE